ncbi:hypothetical protein ES703_69456 [subsurface metagenome]
MKTRTIKLFNKTIPLIPLIVVLAIGSAVAGFAIDDFLTIISHPIQQETYVRTEEIIIGEVVDFLWAGVTLEGETNVAGDFALGRPISVSLIVRSLRPDFYVTDDYTLTIGTDIVLDNAFTDLEMGTDYTDTGSWTPSTLGPIDVDLNIIDMLWTEIPYATFTAFTFVPDGNGLAYESDTLPTGIPILGGSTVTFDLELKTGGTVTLYGFLYDIDVSPDAGTTWSNVLTDGKEWDGGAVMMAPNTMRTFSVSFTAPPHNW